MQGSNGMQQVCQFITNFQINLRPTGGGARWPDETQRES
jgi:hypothetical protein